MRVTCSSPTTVGSAILDWSLVGSLGENERMAIVQVLLGAITLDTARITAVLEECAIARRITRRWFWLCRIGLRRIRRGQFPGMSWLVGMLDDAVQKARLRVTADMMLFRKSLHTLEGVVADVGEGGQIDQVLCTEFLRHFANEWPQRWLRLPHSRDFATRLSNLDLAQTLASCPTTIARFWTGHAMDAMDAYARSAGADVQPADESRAAWSPDPLVQPETSCPSSA